jgi:hypothetical protein
MHGNATRTLWGRGVARVQVVHDGAIGGRDAIPHPTHRSLQGPVVDAATTRGRGPQQESLGSNEQEAVACTAPRRPGVTRVSPSVGATRVVLDEVEAPSSELGRVNGFIPQGTCHAREGQGGGGATSNADQHPQP